MIYLDNAATSKVCPSGIHAVLEGLTEFLNPSANYRQAEQVRNRIETARKKIADFLCCRPAEVYFTSGATESNNWAILSGARKRQKLGAVTSQGEHASVYEPFLDLRQQGIHVSFAPLRADTSVNADELIKLCSDCGFVSLIHASNETGKLNDIRTIFAQIKKQNSNIILHADGVQAFCKVDTDVKKMGVDLYSVSGHKVGAPKGIGALYIREGCGIRSQLHGGGQERKMRAGTENVAGILAFAAAAEEYTNVYRSMDFHGMKKQFYDIVAGVGGIVVNGEFNHSLHNILSMSVMGVKSEILQRILADKDEILIGTGSACAGSKRGNRVLASAGKTQNAIDGNIRIGFGIDTDIDSALYAAQRIAERIREFREVS